MKRLIGATSTSRRERGAVLHGVLFVAVSALAGVLVAGLVIPVAGLFGVTTRGVTEAFNEMDATLPTQRLKERSRMFDAEGEQLTMFYDQNRVEVTLDQVAPVMKDAVLAIEDDRFYEHGPMDIQGTGRAFLRNTQGGDAQGGSTITQQYVKQVLFTTADTPEEKESAMESSYGRKLQELRYAVEVEKKMSKDEVLAGYLNVVYFGNSAYGVESAAKRYFSTSAGKLTVGQAAMLAGLVRDPNRLDPLDNEEQVIERRNFVLQRMAETGRISVKRAKAEMKKPLGLKPQEAYPGCINADYAQHFCDYAYEWLLEEPALGKTREDRKRMLTEGGLTIRTTIDPNVQKPAQRVMNDQVYRTDEVVGALSLVEPGTGQIKGMVQSRGYGDGKGNTYLNYNVGQGDNGTLGIQPGSTFKPFVLAAAIDQGIALDQKFASPSSMLYPTMNDCDGPYKNLSGDTVGNSTDPGAGAIDSYAGTARSINTFYVNLEAATGICDPWKIATKLGVERGDGKELEQVPSFVLGVNNVTPLSMAEAYATFAAEGVHCQAVPVVEVLNRNGDPLPIRDGNCKQRIKKHVARGMNDVLSKVVDGPDPRRTGSAMSLSEMGIQSAGKTGTNDQRVSVSYVGYTTALAAFAVITDDHDTLTTLQGQSVGGDIVSGDEVWGGTLAGPIWHGAMSAALEGKKVAPFTAPDPDKVAGTRVTVPDVNGMSEDDATEALQRAGFTVSNAGTIPSSDVSEGMVAQQSPGANTSYAAGSTVQIWLSSGPQQQPDPPDDDCIRNPANPECWGRPGGPGGPGDGGPWEEWGEDGPSDGVSDDENDEGEAGASTPPANGDTESDPGVGSGTDPAADG